MVDWGANEQALWGSSITQHHWLTKQVSGMCGVGKVMKLWRKQEMDRCPRCGEKETVEHVLELKEESVVQQFQDLVKKLDKWMVWRDTAPEVRDGIKMVLLSWKEGREYKPEPSNQTALSLPSRHKNNWDGKQFLKDTYQGCGGKFNKPFFVDRIAPVRPKMDNSSHSESLGHCVGSVGAPVT